MQHIVSLFGNLVRYNYGKGRNSIANVLLGMAIILIVIELTLDLISETLHIPITIVNIIFLITLLLTFWVISVWCLEFI